MSARHGDLVATDEPTVRPKPFLDAVVVEDSQSDACFPDSAWTDEGDWSETFSETDDLLDKLVTPKTGPRRWGR